MHGEGRAIPSNTENLSGQLRTTLGLRQFPTQISGELFRSALCPSTFMNQIGPSELRKDEFSMHRFHGIPELSADRFEIATTVGDISLETTAKSQLGRGFLKDAES